VMQDLKAVAKAADFKPAENIGRICLVAEEWTPMNGMLTAAQKIKRKDIGKKYAAEIEKMYQS
jgi:long-chain acyl-CoA synthetase